MKRKTPHAFSCLFPFLLPLPALAHCSRPDRCQHRRSSPASQHHSSFLLLLAYSIWFLTKNPKSFSPPSHLGLICFDDKWVKWVEVGWSGFYFDKMGWSGLIFFRKIFLFLKFFLENIFLKFFVRNFFQNFIFWNFFGLFSKNNFLKKFFQNFFNFLKFFFEKIFFWKFSLYKIFFWKFFEKNCELKICKFLKMFFSK